MAEHMLTTTDNPYNPFNNFDAWYNYDRLLASRQGHRDTLSYLAQIARVNTQMPDKMREKAIESAIDEIIEFNIIGTYKKVTEEEADRMLI